MKKIIDSLQDSQYIEISKIDNEIGIEIGRYVNQQADFILKTLSLEEINASDSDLIESTIIQMLKEGDKTEYIDDGFGNQWDKKCPECGHNSMHVVRPGKIQCGNCR